MIIPADYAYTLPPERIAHAPAVPRDSARLLVVNTTTGELIDDVVSNLAAYLPDESLVVFNNTKVVPSRITLTRPTGGNIEALLLVNEYARKGTVPALLPKKVSVGDVLTVTAQKNVTFTVEGHAAGVYDLAYTGTRDELFALLDAHGTMPLPPYIHSEKDEAAQRTDYQPLFAEEPASVAAPTASLHISDRILNALSKKHIAQTYITLHVGRGTFLPFTPAQAHEGTLHTEYFDMPKDAEEKITIARQEGQPIVAVGTTVARTLESWVRGIRRSTDIFIQPPFTFSAIDVLMTNFHVPESSLLVLLDAFLKSKRSKISWKDIYAHAIAAEYRFYSFGDAMLVL